MGGVWNKKEKERAPRESLAGLIWSWMFSSFFFSLSLSTSSSFQALFFFLSFSYLALLWNKPRRTGGGKLVGYRDAGTAPAVLTYFSRARTPFACVSRYARNATFFFFSFFLSQHWCLLYVVCVYVCVRVYNTADRHNTRPKYQIRNAYLYNKMLSIEV